MTGSLAKKWHFKYRLGHKLPMSMGGLTWRCGGNDLLSIVCFMVPLPRELAGRSPLRFLDKTIGDIG